VREVMLATHDTPEVLKAPGWRRQSDAGSRPRDRAPRTSRRAGCSRRSARSSAASEVSFPGMVRGGRGGDAARVTGDRGRRGFGPVVAGLVIERGDGLGSDFCILARIEPGKPVVLSYPEDEDELEEYQPDYLGWASYTLCRSLLQATFAGQRPIPKAILRGEVRLHGDLERLVKHAGRTRAQGWKRSGRCRPNSCRRSPWQERLCGARGPKWG